MVQIEEIRVAPTMFRYRQQIRRWAARALTAWSCSVAIGVVHACLAPQPIELREQRLDFSVAAQVPLTGHSESAEAHHGGMPGEDGSLADSNCQAFCEKSAVAVPPLKSAIDKVLDHALPAVPVAIFGTVAAPPLVQLPMPRRDRAAPTPIGITFLRLTL